MHVLHPCSQSKIKWVVFLNCFYFLTFIHSRAHPYLYILQRIKNCFYLNLQLHVCSKFILHLSVLCLLYFMKAFGIIDHNHNFEVLFLLEFRESMFQKITFCCVFLFTFYCCLHLCIISSYSLSLHLIIRCHIHAYSFQPYIFEQISLFTLDSSIQMLHK